MLISAIRVIVSSFRALSHRPTVLCMVRLRPALPYLAALLFSQLLYNAVYSYYGKTIIEEMYGTQRFLVVDLFAFNDGSGLGNLVFELMGTIALARKLQRTLIVHRTVYDKMHEKYPEFANLIGEIRWNVSNEIIPFGPVFNYQSYHCCRFNPKWREIAAEGQVVTVKVQYLQSFKYFDSLPLEEVRRLLGVNETLRSIAREELVKKSRLDKSDHKLCVHSRRGDFLRSYEQAPSTQAFIVPAVEFLLKQLTNSTVKRPLVVMIGDDLSWQGETAKRIKGAEIVVLPRSTSTTSASVDWQFSEIYCDTVLLTAPASTFGWWLAYVSKGQKVYYSSVYEKPGRFADHLLPEEFFPHSWTSLEQDSLSRIGIKARTFRS